MHSEPSMWPILASQLLGQLPSTLVWIVAMVLAVVRRHQHPQVSTLVLVAGVLILVNTVAGGYFSAWIPLMLRQGGMPPRSLGVILGIVTLVRSFMAAVTAGLLVWAIFGWRSKPGQGQG